MANPVKSISLFFKTLWKLLDTPEIDQEDPSPKIQHKKQMDSYCPFCGYGGSTDEVRCHLLNYHKPN